MSASLLPPKQVKVESKKGLPDHCIFADRYAIEDLTDYKLVYFGRAGQTRALHGICLAEQAIKDCEAPLKEFFQKMPPLRDGHVFEVRDLAPSNTMFPIDMINVSHRGSEAEFLFCSYSLRDLALAGKSTKHAKTDVIIEGWPQLMVRCPLIMLQSMLMKLLMNRVK